jgi:hypothetical protein
MFCHYQFNAVLIFLIATNVTCRTKPQRGDILVTKTLYLK